MKMLDTSVPIDVLADNVNFPEHRSMHDECSSNVDSSPAGMFELKDVKHELAQVSWLTQNKTFEVKEISGGLMPGCHIQNKQ